MVILVILSSWCLRSINKMKKDDDRKYNGMKVTWKWSVEVEEEDFQRGCRSVGVASASSSTN